MRNRVLLTVLVAALFAGCTTTGGELASTTTDRPTAEPPIMDIEEPERTTPPPQEPEYATIGGTDGYTWDDGISVIVSAPVDFTPSEYAAFDPAPAYLRFTITIKNDSAVAFDPSLFMTTLQSGGFEATEVYDGETLGNGPETNSLLAGRTLAYEVGYGVQDASDLVLEVVPSFEHDPGVFVSE